MALRAAELLVLHPAPHRRIPLSRRTTVGRREDCDLRFFDSGVEPVHAVILPSDGGWTLRSASYILCRVNDRDVVETILADRDVIQLGDATLGFRLLKPETTTAEPMPPVAASLVALREDVAAERSLLAEERSLWEAELGRRRSGLVERETAFRRRASRTARAVHRERERVQRDAKRNRERSEELDRLAAKLAEAEKRLGFERQALGVEQRHADDELRKIERRRGLVGAESEATAARLAERKKELLKLDLEIERRRKDLERYAAPDAVVKERTLIEREFAAAAKERESEAALQELSAMFQEVDALLANLERLAAAAPHRERLPALRIAPETESEAPTLLPIVVRGNDAPHVDVVVESVDLVAWADETQARSAADAWWDAREEEFQQAVRVWREEKQALLSDLHEKQHAVAAARSALAEHEACVAREIARDRMNLHREREGIDRRRAWLDRAQQRFSALQTAALAARIRPDDPDALHAEACIREMKATEELWQQFRCDVLRERMELACERERWKVRDHELVSLRRLAAKQRALLAAIVSDQALRERLLHCERKMKEAAALERESAIERLACALLGDEQPRKVKPAAATEERQRKAA